MVTTRILFEAPRRRVRFSEPTCPWAVQFPAIQPQPGYTDI